MTSECVQASNAAVVADTVLWLERVVIGLNLCPFAKGVHVKGQVHYAVSTAQTSNELLVDLDGELKALASLDASQRDTTLLIVPDCLQEFIDFNDFLVVADRVLQDAQLGGVIQIASFHPQYQFAGTTADDISNFTNRAPYPTLHLLREDSIARAVQTFLEAEAIFEKNIQTMETLGAAGWAILAVAPTYVPIHPRSDQAKRMFDSAD
jgi:uncharacterized protein